MFNLQLERLMYDRKLRTCGWIGLGSICFLLAICLCDAVASPYHQGEASLLARRILGCANQAMTIAFLSFMALSSVKCGKALFTCVAIFALDLLPVFHSTPCVSAVATIIKYAVPVVVFSLLVFKNTGRLRSMLIAILVAEATALVYALAYSVPFLVSPDPRPVLPVMRWTMTFVTIARSVLLTAVYMVLVFNGRKPGSETVSADESAKPRSSTPLHWRIFAVSIPLIAIIGCTTLSAEYLLLFAIMPCGLLALVHPGLVDGFGFVVGLVAGWSAYIAVDVVIIRSKNWRRLMLTVAALIVMILANVAGCARMFSHNFHS